MICLISKQEGDRKIKKILIINNLTEEQKRLQSIFERSDTEVVFIHTISDALIQLSTQKFSLIILDISITVKNGYEFCTIIQKAASVPIVIVSAQSGVSCNEYETIRLYYENIAGCSCYFKNNRKNDLSFTCDISQIGTVQITQGECCYVMVFGNDLIIDSEKRQVYLKGMKLHLTRKEFDILLCLVRNAGKVLTREQIYREIWENEISYSIDEIIKTHIKTLRKKLSVSNSGYIRNVWGVGYCFEPETKEDGE